MLFSSNPPTSNNTHHPPPPAESSLHGAVLGQWPPSKADCLDAVASRVPPLVALVAGQVQVARGGPFRGKAACSSVSSCFRVTCTLCIWCSGLQGIAAGTKAISSAQTQFSSPGGGGWCKGGEEEGGLVRQLPCPLWTLPAPGFRVGANEKTRLSVSPASLPSHPKMSPVFQPLLLESLPPLGCLTPHVQIHLVVGTGGVDGAQRVFPNLVSLSSGSTKEER